MTGGGRRALVRLWPLAALAALVASACSTGRSTPAAGRKVEAQVASYDLAAGPPGRVIVGLLTSDQHLIGWGTVRMRFCFVGVSKADTPCRYGAPATGRFLPIPGTRAPSPPPSSPRFVGGAEGSGVYGATTAFDRAGFWRVEVTARIGGDDRRAVSSFAVAEHHAVPGPGDDALNTENLTRFSADAPAGAVDSRAANEPIPDPELHQTTIAASLAAHRPVLAVFSTPVYCISRFCGPVTDMVQELAHVYADRAAFVHVEIWRDYENHTLNRAAAEWLLRNDDLNEPWVFLIGADGRVAARWDNVATRGEIEPLLRDLPVIG